MTDRKFKIGIYTIRAKYYENRLIDITCNCMWGTVHNKNWWLGGKLCKHINEIVKKYGTTKTK